MTLEERMNEARHRQRVQGRLRWLLDDFCGRASPFRPGELLDLGDDVRAFADADDLPEPTADDLRSIQGDVLEGLKALFWHKPWLWSLGPVTVVLDFMSELPGGRGARKVRPGSVDHKAAMFPRLALPLRLRLQKGRPVTQGEKDPLRTRFVIAVMQELVSGWRLIGQCPRCYSFFFVVRRQRFCTPQCKQEEMDARKAQRREHSSRDKRGERE